jgi:type IV pilus assembly protein PilA
MKALQKGFTLIELMIVVAIIGILAAIAIPAYQDYTIRAQVTEGLNLADGLKVAVADFYTQNGVFPAAGVTTLTTASGLAFTAAVTGKYSTVDLPNAGTATSDLIVATFQNANGLQANAKLNGLKVAISPYVSSNGDLVWQCGMSKAPTLNIPTAGTDASLAANTTVPAKWLPASCK